MIIRLSTAQISTHWEAIKDMIVRAVPDLPGQFANRENNILRSLLIGESVCWIGYKNTEEKKNNIVGMMITRIIYDDITDIRSLLIYCIASWEVLDYSFYREGFGPLKDYAKEASCNRIIFYSDELRVIKLAEDLGFNTDLHFGVCQL